MDVSTAQLAALVAIADLGTFESAARRLHVTPSAISQRIRALEAASGQVLIRRGSPCVTTPAGERLLAVARQTQLLLAEVADVLPDAGAMPTELPVAVNADSLATWWRPVLGDLATWDGVALRLRVEDQAFSHELLRRGEALASVTSEPTPVQGCRVERLGALRYVPAAAPWFAERWRRGRGYDWGRMPMVAFNDKDALQDQVLRFRGMERPSIVHQVPTSADFHEALRLGLGWATLPEPQLLPDVAAGRLVVLATRAYADVELFWQRWRLASPLLDRLTAAVRRAARAGLRR